MSYKLTRGSVFGILLVECASVVIEGVVNSLIGSLIECVNESLLFPHDSPDPLPVTLDIVISLHSC